MRKLKRGVGTIEYHQAMAKGKNPHAVALGKLGGKKSGKARMEKLTSEQRREIARNAVRARWAKRKGNDGA